MAFSEWGNLASVTSNGHNIRHILNPSWEIQVAAVRENGGAIASIVDPSEELQLLVVRHEGFHLANIKNPSLAVVAAAIYKSPSIVFENYPQLVRHLTPEILDRVKPGLAASRAAIAVITQDFDARVSLFSAALRGQPIADVLLPANLQSH